ncbi:MAG: hypothetical protein QOK04_1610 [Solirubrobacteraceae bacterium]|jgi:hypothetical protein|nr:hypothetical protein [Solirubrobacteraceae bacterium]
MQATRPVCLTSPLEKPARTSYGHDPAQRAGLSAFDVEGSEFEHETEQLRPRFAEA